MGYKKNTNLLIFLLLILLVQFTHSLWKPGDSLSSQSTKQQVTNGLEPVVLAPDVNIEVWRYFLKYNSSKIVFHKK